MQEVILMLIKDFGYVGIGLLLLGIALIGMMMLGYFFKTKKAGGKDKMSKESSK